MIPMLREFAILLLAPERLQDFLDLLITIDECREDRNFIVHGAWFVLRPANIPAAASLRPKSEKGEVITETFPPGRMHKLISDIEDCRFKIITLDHEITTLRDKLILRPPPG
jgi:hypothetical protein